MPDVDLGGKKMPEYVFIDVKGKVPKKIALIGLDTDDMLAYPDGAFGGAKILPVLETAKKFQAKLKDQCDLIIPLTHLRSNQDIELAKLKLNFPIMIAAHDHFLFHQIVEGQHIFKLGMDAQYLGCVDINWMKGDPNPVINCTIHDARMYAPEPDLYKRIKEHSTLVEELRLTNLAHFPAGAHITSQHGAGGKKGHSMGRFLATSAQRAFGTDLCMLVNGCMRGFIDYKDRAYFTYAHLLKELPGEVPMVTIKLPGKVIVDVVHWSRDEGYAENPGAFLHVQHDVKFSDETYTTLTHIGGQPIDPSRNYSVVLNFALIGENESAAYNMKPLLDYIKAHPDIAPDTDEGGRTLQVALVEYFSISILLHLTQSHSLGAGDIERGPLMSVLRESGKYSEHVMEMLVDNLMEAGGAQNGKIPRGNLIKLALKNSDFPTDQTGEIPVGQLRTQIDSLLGQPLKDEEFARVQTHIPVVNGKVQKQAMFDWLNTYRASNIGVYGQGEDALLHLPDMMMAKTH
eukprot:NODE_782_length_1872_cov_240.124355_g729_i0.p1 GENE.NODE_782_length_1872_cov_240.124355_g729_i0~~NODE_782_length_1872_cov_240.124355_g729_i0.p1  ORF type:complete len:515 (-),score=128.12 NODE_782_length_1872_cov_240.124355_g729_i0:88-1632(-)